MNLETYLTLREDWKSWRRVVEEVREYRPEAISEAVDKETFPEWVVRTLAEQQLALNKVIEEKEW